MSLDRIVSYWGIGNGSGPRGMNNLTPDGWQVFVDKQLRPLFDKGITRFLLWMPFGREEHERDQTVNGVTFKSNLRFDQYLLARTQGPSWITDGFVDAVGKLAADGARIIAYTGTLPGAPEYERERWHRLSWLEKCLKPFFDANCDIGLDSLVRCPWNHYGTVLVDELRRRARNSPAKVYVESMPIEPYPHHAKGDVISDEGQYQQSCNEANRKYLCDPKLVTGEIVRGFWYPPKDVPLVDWYRKAVPQALSEGHSACVFVRNFMNAGGRLEELVI